MGKMRPQTVGKGTAVHYVIRPVWSPRLKGLYDTAMRMAGYGGRTA